MPDGMTVLRCRAVLTSFSRRKASSAVSVIRADRKLAPSSSSSFSKDSKELGCAMPGCHSQRLGLLPATWPASTPLFHITDASYLFRCCINYNGHYSSSVAF